MLRVFPIATTSAETVPGFSDDWDAKSGALTISAEAGSPVVAVDEGYVYTDPTTQTTRLRAIDNAIYDYGSIERVHDDDHAAHVGAIIGRVSETGTIRFAVFPAPKSEPVNPYTMLASAPNLLIPSGFRWRAAAKLVAMAAAGLGVGATLAVVFYRVVSEAAPKTREGESHVVHDGGGGQVRSELPRAGTHERRVSREDRRVGGGSRDLPHRKDQERDS